MRFGRGQGLNEGCRVLREKHAAEMCLSWEGGSGPEVSVWGGGEEAEVSGEGG